MSSQVKQAKRYIDKDALIAQTKSSIEWRKRGSVKKGEEWKSSLDEVIQTAICEGIAKIIELIESAPIEETLDDVLDRIPKEEPEGELTLFWISEEDSGTEEGEWRCAHTNCRFDYETNGSGSTPIEAAKKLEKLLSRSTP